MTEMMLSIKPYYADLVLSGKKPLELRKQLIRSTLKVQGCKTYLYASSPVKKVIGECTIVSERFDLKRQKELEYYHGDQYYDKICSDACISFEDYIGKYKRYEHYTIHHPRRYPVPFDLSSFGINSPPQSYCYLKHRDLGNYWGIPCYSCIYCLSGQCLIKDIDITGQEIDKLGNYSCNNYAEGSHYSSIEDEDEGPTGVVFSFNNGKMSIGDARGHGQ